MSVGASFDDVNGCNLLLLTLLCVSALESVDVCVSLAVLTHLFLLLSVDCSDVKIMHRFREFTECTPF